MIRININLININSSYPDDWAKFLETYFKKIPGISKFHHFRFCKDHPGLVHYSEKP